ncbi:MAG: DNA internalization-related competence protein ComEC/Rec2 [Melioribacteraceae bacterium]|nr:DNA internalization-related competence protein ComEC/Rec2 [Melioribacteraceae bacterium]
MKNYPVIKVAMLFILGIILQKVFNLQTGLLLYPWILFFVLSIIFLLFYKKESLQICFVILTLIISGAFYFSYMFNPVSYPFQKEKLAKSNVFGTISDIELEKENKIIIFVDTDSVKHNNNSVNINTKLRCAIYDSTEALRSLYSKLGIGDKLKITGTIIRPRNIRNPGEFDYELYLNQIDVAGIINTFSSKEILLLDKASPNFKHFIFQVRKSVDQLLESSHNKTTHSLLRGLLLADRSLISYESRNEFISAGVIHVLAVSGLHVGFIAMIFVFLFSRFGFKAKMILTIFGLVVFTLICGAPPSVVRASIMAIVIIIAKLTGRSTNLFNSLAIAALIIILINPNELFSPGFQLSFSAVLSIGIMYPILNKLFNAEAIRNRYYKYIIQFVAVSLSAQIGTLPFTIYYFEKVSLVALLANFFVIPLIGIILITAFITLFISIIFPFLTLFYASANEFLTFILFNIVHQSAVIKYSSFEVFNYSIYDGLVFYLSVVTLFFVLKKFVTTIPKIIAVILLFPVSILFSQIDNEKLLDDKKFNLVMLDVGQGDSFFIMFPDGKTALIDAGEKTEYFDIGEYILYPFFKRNNIKKIDYAFVSHLDTDHAGGFNYLVEKNFIDTIYLPTIDSTNSEDLYFNRRLKEYGVITRNYNKSRLNISGAELYILNDEYSNRLAGTNSNRKSGLMKLVFGNYSFLFTGDTDKFMEGYYSRRYAEFLNSTFLKVGHHGSKTSTSEIFLNLVNPQNALISCGVENKFKHPSKSIIDLLEGENISIFRTDKSGAVIFTTDGKELNQINWRNL